MAAIVTACNQKSNRDPVTNYDQDDVEDTLHGLRKKGAVILVEGSGRVARWKHTLYEWLKVSKVELAVLAELLLRGPQTEGDLRARASRMEPLADLPVLQAILEALVPRGAWCITSRRPARSGGCSSRTGCILPRNWSESGRRSPAESSRTTSPRRGSRRPRVELAATAAAPGWVTEIAALRAEVQQLRASLEALAAEVRDLKSALGA